MFIHACLCCVDKFVKTDVITTRFKREQCFLSFYFSVQFS